MNLFYGLVMLCVMAAFFVALDDFFFPFVAERWKEHKRKKAEK